MSQSIWLGLKGICHDQKDLDRTIKKILKWLLAIFLTLVAIVIGYNYFSIGYNAVSFEHAVLWWARTIIACAAAILSIFWAAGEKIYKR